MNGKLSKENLQRLKKESIVKFEYLKYSNKDKPVKPKKPKLEKPQYLPNSMWFYEDD